MSEKKAVIGAIKQYSKVATAKVTFDEKKTWLDFWYGMDDFPEIATGKELMLSGEQRQDTKDPNKKQWWVLSVNGKQATPKGKFGGGVGGGGYKAPPKTALEIHASCVAGIIKSGEESAMPPETVGEYLDLYWKHMARVAS